MRSTLTISALLAPAGAYAAAFDWALPEPTLFAPEADNWSPAPTAAPHFPGIEVFRRQVGEGNNTCAFISGSSQSSITCSNSNLVCATNSRYGAHGCCDPAHISDCVIPTRCVASTDMSKSCSDASCSSDPAVMKCTLPAATECYRWSIVYSTTTMTQNGCTDKGFTSTAQRAWGLSSMPTELYKTATVTIIQTPSSTPTLSSSPSPKPGIGAIVGGTIGGCVFFSIIALIAFLIYRKRQNAKDTAAQRPVTQFHGNGAMTEYNPHGFQSPYMENDHKTWQQQQQGPVHRADNSMPLYPGMGVDQYGLVEVDGTQRPVEVPADAIYKDQYRSSHA